VTAPGLLSVAAVFIALFGCGATGQDDVVGGSVEDVTEAVPAEVAGDPAAASWREVVSEFSVGDSTFAFELMSAGDTPSSVLINEVWGSFNRIAALTTEYGPVTSLEIFEAFAPAGSEPHPFLFAAHEDEALAIGRSGADLAVKFLDGHGLTVDKGVPSACVSPNFLPPIAPFTYSDITENRIDIDGLAIYTCLGSPLRTGVGDPSGCERFHPSKRLTATACNDTSSISSTTPRFTIDGLADRFPITLRPGANRTVTLQPVSPVPQPFLSRSIGIEGTNNTEDSRNAQNHVGAVGNPP
jgi:hypothetical protein